MYKLNFLFTCLLLSFTVFANSNVPINKTEWRSLAATESSAVQPRAVLRDPFSDPQVTYNSQGSAFNQAGNNGFGNGFQRGRGSFTVPELVFKGYIETDDDKEPMALIQIGQNKVHMVREGDEINIDPSQPRNAIRITKINRLSITVETGILGTMRVLR